MRLTTRLADAGVDERIEVCHLKGALIGAEALTRIIHRK